MLADLLGGVGDQPADDAPERADVPRLFASTEEFARAALDSAAPELRVDDDGEMLAFRPPDDLVQRLAVLPPAYLRRHDVTERMRVTFDRRLAQRKLDEARDSKTLWPEIAYLSDLHPMIDWLTDKVLLRVPRQQCPGAHRRRRRSPRSSSRASTPTRSASPRWSSGWRSPACRTTRASAT